MAYRGVINCLLLFCLAVCAEESLHGMISGYLGRGRADIFFRGKWGSIGNTRWDNKDAAAFCRSLGYSSGVAIPSSEIYNSRDTIWLDNVYCKGDETNLDQCKHLDWGETIVDKTRPASEIIAGVQCFGDVVRITGGQTQGRAEIFSDGKWGSIAAEHWDDNDAKVFCSMLGFKTGKAKTLPSVPIVYTDIQCTGNETSIVHCPQIYSYEDPLGCVDADVAGVECEGAKVRIVGGVKKGRAEIFYDGKWGTICDSPGNNDAATVFCRMLGFWTGRYPSQAKTKADPSTPIWIQESFCTGNETTLAQCGYQNLKDTNCTHDEDIEVACSNVHARVTNSANFVGRAEIFFGGQYLPVCSNAMTVHVVDVFCRTIGLRFGAKIPSNQTSLYTMHLANITCKGDEQSIQQCTDIKWTTLGCGGHPDALVRCAGDVALIGTQNEVKLFKGETVGSVCAHKWGRTDAIVFCRMKGYRRAKVSKVTLLEHTADFHMTNVDCRGHEFSLYQCPYKLLDNECENNEMAAVNCKGKLVRIVGETEKKGRAEIFYNGRWGTICSNYWDVKSAKVFCQMLDYSNGDVFDPYDAPIPEHTGPIWLSDVSCTGNEGNILQCGHTDWEDHQCIHEYDTGVECF